MTTNYMAGFRSMLDGGAPANHVQSEVLRHLTALRALPDNTEDKTAAIKEATEFLTLVSTLASCK